jgi:hypothetical protein
MCSFFLRCEITIFPTGRKHIGGEWITPFILQHFPPKVHAAMRTEVISEKTFKEGMPGPEGWIASYQLGRRPRSSCVGFHVSGIASTGALLMVSSGAQTSGVHGPLGVVLTGLERNSKILVGSHEPQSDKVVVA